MQKLFLDFAEFRVRKTTCVSVAIKSGEHDVVIPPIVLTMVSVEVQIDGFRCGRITFQFESVFLAVGKLCVQVAKLKIAIDENWDVRIRLEQIPVVTVFRSLRIKMCCA